MMCIKYYAFIYHLFGPNLQISHKFPYLNILLLVKKVNNLLHMGSRQAKVLEVSEVCPSHDCCYQHSLIWLDDYRSYWYW